MKKLLCIAAFAGMLSFGYCQDVKVNINNQEATTKEECPYRINGICSTEDIGGVDVLFSFKKTEGTIYVGNSPFPTDKGNTYATFTNYNSFPVTVLYEIKGNGTTKGSIVLSANGSKQVKIVSDRSDYSTDCEVLGIIVRKLQN